jgi:hypothetical protein
MHAQSKIFQLFQDFFADNAISIFQNFVAQVEKYWQKATD